MGLTVLVSLILVACTAAALTPGGKTIRAGRFELVGETGEVLAELSGKPGATALCIYGRGDDGPLAVIGVAPVDEGTRDKPNAFLHLENGSETTYSLSAVAQDEGASLEVIDGQHSIYCGIQRGESSIKMEGAHPRLELRVSDEETSIRGSNAVGSELFRQP